MTQYLLSVWSRENEPMPSDEETQALYAATDRFNDEVRASGAWVFAGGLHPVTTATVVDNTKGGEPITTDGPFAESKEHLGGFWIIKASDLDAALALAERASAACANPVEVRPFQDDDGS